MIPDPQQKLSSAQANHWWKNGEFLLQEESSAMLFFRAGMVYGIQVRSAGDAIKVQGKVATRTLKPMEVKITLLPSGQRDFEILSSCTCVEGGNCKHVAGVLKAAANKWYKPREDLQKAEDAANQAPEPDQPVEPEPAPPPPPPKLSPFLQNWMRQLKEIEEQEDEENFFPPSDTASRLVYLFKRGPAGSQEVVLELHTAKLTEEGAYALTNPFKLDFKSPPEFLSPSDIEIVDAVRRLRGDETIHPNGALWGVLLPRILNSGRAMWETPGNPSLQLDEESVAVTPGWYALESGVQRPVLQAMGRNLAVVATRPLFVIDTVGHSVHRVTSERPEHFLLGWLKLPELSPLDADHLAHQIEHGTAARALPAPARLRVVQESGTKPQAVLRLFGDTVYDGYYAIAGVFGFDQKVRMALVEITYAAAPGKRFTPGMGAERILARHDDRVVELVRDLDEERRLADQLAGGMLRRAADVLTFGLKPAYRDAWLLAPDSPTRWIRFLNDEAKHLQESGWTLHQEPTFDLELLNPTAWHDQITETSRHDWFTVECAVEVDGQRVPLLPAIIAYLRTEGMGASALAELEKMGTQPVMLPIQKKFLAIPAERLHRILSALTELFSKNPQLLPDGTLEIHRLRAAQLAGISTAREGKLFAQTSATLAELSSQLRTFHENPTELPKSLKAELRPYQFEGYRWLRFLATTQIAGVLADDMGLGKTLQTLAHLLKEKELGKMDRPSLIVAPKSVVFNWAEESSRFTPKLRVMIYSGQDRAKLTSAFTKNDLILTSYPLLARDADLLAGFDFHYVILDEAQNIKNSQTQTAMAAFRLNARLRLCLSGTPMENHLGELWSIFHFLLPGFLGQREQFNAVFRDPIEKDGNQQRRQELSQRVAPVLLRRTKENVLQDLPPKIETIHRVELTEAQKDLYESVRAAMDDRVQDEIRLKGAARSQIMVLDALLKLRQVCCDPRLVKLAAAQKVTESAKLDALMEILPELIEEGRKVLLFSQFTEMLALIQQRLIEENIEHLLLTGQSDNRQQLVHRFQNGDAPVFLISLKAGGVGLNLTAADTVIHYDPWWNPAAENQATDRAHRIGQKKTVFVYKFICQDTIEEKILLLQRKKAELVAGLLEGTGERLRITEEDIAYLLAPMKSTGL